MLGRLMIGVFGALAVAWYALSGGRDFAPGDVGVTVFAPPLSVAERAASQSPAVPQQAALAPRAPAPEPAPQAAAVATPRPDPLDGVDPESLRRVGENRVSMRGGSDRSFGVLMELLQGERVAVLRTRGDWVQVRVVDGGAVGWVEARYLGPIGAVPVVQQAGQ